MYCHSSLLGLIFALKHFGWSFWENKQEKEVHANSFTDKRRGLEIQHLERKDFVSTYWENCQGNGKTGKA